jgi:hypothetical protein
VELPSSVEQLAEAVDVDVEVLELRVNAKTAAVLDVSSDFLVVHAL